MCKKLDMVVKNKYGEIYHCSTCKRYHVLFTNFHFILNYKQIKTLRKRIKDIDVKYWDSQFENTTIKRKIPIPTCQENLILIFDKVEFNAFKSLFFSQKKSEQILSVDEIEYTLILN